MSKMIYDVSIGQWRFRTQADIDYGKKLLEHL